MKKIFYFMVVAVLLGSCEDTSTTETGSIHGAVVASGEPVNAAALLLTPSGGVKITGSDGMYAFTELELGRYEIKVFKEGYLSFNQSIEVTNGSTEVAATLTKARGHLSLNKSYVDLGSNESNNTAGFSIVNSGNTDVAWSITNVAKWITKVEPASGTVPANGATAVVITIDRSRLGANATDNHATLVLNSTSAGDGSVAELLVTVFGKGYGTNTTISDEPYVVIDSLYVQTQDLGTGLTWLTASATCSSSSVGGYNDWRLPTIGELTILYSKKGAIGRFVTESTQEVLSNKRIATSYWSSSPRVDTRYYWMSFYDGYQSYGDDDYHEVHRCRCVRKTPEPDYITLPTANIMVQKSDIISGVINYTIAENLCESSTVGGYADWRLPTLNELSTMYDNKTQIGGFKTTYARYWSSTPNGTNYYYQIQFSDGGTQSSSLSNSSVNSYGTTYSYYARCVRTLP